MPIYRSQPNPNLPPTHVPRIFEGEPWHLDSDNPLDDRHAQRQMDEIMNMPASLVSLKGLQANLTANKGGDVRAE
jgi:hypothetical protein